MKNSAQERPGAVGQESIHGGAATHDAHATRDAHATPDHVVALEANVDDADPRLWPGVIDSMLAAGALDCWLMPIIMKGGRPAVTVHALVREGEEIRLADRLIALTGTLGVRYAPMQRRILTRQFATITVDQCEVRVKISTAADGTVVRAEPEFRDVARAARELGVSEREMLERAKAAARACTPKDPQ